jgi:hypothetical protein
VISIASARRLALALPEAVEQDHHGRPSFRVRGRIFATLHVADKRMVVKLTPGDQALRLETQPEVFSAVPSWGHQGWTFVALDAIGAADLKATLDLAWRGVAPKRLVSNRSD